MTIPDRRALVMSIVVGLSLALGSACKRPETAARERPVQRVELVQAVEGMTPAEEKAAVAQLAEGFGVSAEAADQAVGPTRVFRLTLKGKPNPAAGRSLGKTWLVSTGEGFLVGALVPAAAAAWASWKSVAIGAGAGTLLGFGYGPIQFKDNQALQQKLGYLPWVFTSDWEVVERSPGVAEAVIASSQNRFRPLYSTSYTHLDLRPHLRPLPPETRSAADIRQASLRAYLEALEKHFRAKG